MPTQQKRYSTLLRGKGRDLIGQVYWDIERCLKIAVVPVEWDPIFD